ncbi:MAG: threonyl-tRNA synthetase editing domain-containing protein [Bacteroidales bacterium]|nr:threonyl-tRNA synthetase editing domain-containing protein [Bacteroidales bacterium]
MKILMIYCNSFYYKPTIKTLEEVKEKTEAKEFKNALVGFIQVEAEDENDPSGVEKKLVKNLKWAAKKNNTKTVVLHSFAHLSDSKALPEFTIELFDKVEARMKNAEYDTHQTAFGYFMDLKIDAPGLSLARIFKGI